MATHPITSLVAAAAVTLTLGTGLAACSTDASAPSGSSASAPSAGPAHNQADVTFAQDMIEHHAQAIAMSKMAIQRAGSPQVKNLAARIQAAQQPEMDQMGSWLHAWNAPVPSTNGPMAGMDHDATGAMPGMMTSDQMRQLKMVPGDKFDQMYLRMMIAHHKGAITMARSELSGGQNTEARELAQRIIDTQQREISEMQAFPGV
ncbi:MAG TPA: DUF305 domain-containing protein [Pseudonocardiaceae bacterium]|jgi:uncharacterized protein (DUF305 family)|nr:DUF305 domain-containing protein [Pseudonocardiaceae bacterium]